MPETRLPLFPALGGSRNLVVARAGRASLHSGWIDGPEPAGFDLLVAATGGRPVRPDLTATNPLSRFGARHELRPSLRPTRWTDPFLKARPCPLAAE